LDYNYGIFTRSNRSHQINPSKVSNLESVTNLPYRKGRKHGDWTNIGITYDEVDINKINLGSLIIENIRDNFYQVYRYLISRPKSDHSDTAAKIALQPSLDISRSFSDTTTTDISHPIILELEKFLVTCDFPINSASSSTSSSLLVGPITANLLAMLLYQKLGVQQIQDIYYLSLEDIKDELALPIIQQRKFIQCICYSHSNSYITFPRFITSEVYSQQSQEDYDHLDNMNREDINSDSLVIKKSDNDYKQLPICEHIGAIKN